MVFSVVGMTAFIGYASALWPMSIWYGRALSLTIKSTIDGLIFAAVTAGTFVSALRARRIAAGAVR